MSTISFNVDPILLPILLIIVAELFRVESRISRLEQEFIDFLDGRRNGRRSPL
jgi:hypothetical protein